MATIAKASINLVSISDAYSVSLQPSNITINADAYGKNPNLTNAFTIISLYCGDDQVAIQSGNIIGSSMDSSDYTQHAVLSKFGESLKLQITGVSETDLDGWREIEIFTKAGQRLIARFSYTIVRETSMLDWIIEWNKNYTQITGDHVASPNAFIGGKDAMGLLSGVYLGADMPNHPIGIYAVKDCPAEAFAQGNIDAVEIFHLNENGGRIGGWDISQVGLITPTSVGQLEILSQGTIHHLNNQDTTTPFWELKSDGSGSLASGNIFWDTSGNATFNGKLTTKEGEIGGWNIGQTALYNQSILINSYDRFIGIRNASGLTLSDPSSKANFYSALKDWGGVAMYFTDSSNYGLEGWITTNSDTNGPLSSAKIFSLGSENLIAGWKFNHTALYKGNSPTNTAGAYTANSGDVTIGSNGIRGFKWYIDYDGEADFMNGLVHFGPTKSQISGWNLQANRLSTAYTVITSETNGSGFFIGSKAISGNTAKAMIQEIQTNGGLYLTSLENSQFELAAFSGDNNVLFRLSSSNISKIAAWSFDETRIYVGNPGLLSKTNYAAFPDSLILDSVGIHAPAWFILADGSGSLAGGAITWTSEGDVQFSENVYLSWDSETNSGTYITSKGVFTGKISANNIDAGTISAVSVLCKDKWALNADGSGYLACKNIEWQSDGTLDVKGKMTVQQLDFDLQLVNDPPTSSHPLNKVFSWIDISLSQRIEYSLPALQQSGCRMLYVFLYTDEANFTGEVVFAGGDNGVLVAVGSTMKPEIMASIRPSFQEDYSVEGLYQLVGVRNGSNTVWRIFKIG